MGAFYLGVAGCLPDKRRDNQPDVHGGFEIPRQALDSVEYGLSMEDFRAQLGTNFTLATPAGALDLTLVAVNEGRPAGGEGEAFDCVFQPARAVELSQNAYQTSHAKLGTFSLFVVPFAGPDPVTGGARPTQYVASFNRV
jgi:hypothetical protein